MSSLRVRSSPLTTSTVDAFMRRQSARVLVTSAASSASRSLSPRLLSSQRLSSRSACSHCAECRGG
eukprot:323833-Chlamydomonas_euryale.AAC.1